MPARIAVLTGASLAWNPRALKEASALSGAGYNVTVVGASHSREGLETDQDLARRCGFSFISVIPAERSLATSGSALWRIFRVRAAQRLFAVSGLETGWQVGPLSLELLRAARRLAADYYIVHLEQAAWAGTKLIDSGKAVGIDMEDWYSEDLLPEVRRQRPLDLLRALERKMLREGAHSTSPSRAMSEALAREYACPPPAVVYNVFRWADRQKIDGLRKDRRDRSAVSIHWFSQTIGRGRGLDDLLGALQLLSGNTELHLRGRLAPDFGEWLNKQVPPALRERVFIHDLVSNDELLSRIAEHDIGFAGETSDCRSRDLTITNKIFYYLLAGIPVVASDTAGQREVFQKAPAAICLYPSGDSAALAARLGELLADPARREHARAQALAVAEHVFSWERQQHPLLQAVSRALCKEGLQNPNDSCLVRSPTLVRR